MRFSSWLRGLTPVSRRRPARHRRRRTAATTARAGIERLEGRLLLSYDFGYALGLGSAGIDVGVAIAADTAGNVAVAGNFYQESIDIDPGPGSYVLPNAGGTDGFAAQYDPLGNLRWGVHFGSAVSNGAGRLAVDASGNTFVAGTFTDSVQIGALGATPVTLSAAGGIEGLLAKIDPSGNVLWARTLGENGFRRLAAGIALDSAGNVYATGKPEGTNHMYVAKYDGASGATVWSHAIQDGTGINYGGYISFTSGSDVAVDAFGNVRVTGRYMGTIDFNPDPAVTNSLTNFRTKQNTVNVESDGFILKLDAAGGYLRAGSLGGAGPDFAGLVATDGTGNAYVTGVFEYWEGDADPGPGTLMLPAGPFMVKLDPNDNLIWGRSIGLSTLEVDAAGSIYSTGGFSGTIDADPGPDVFNLTSVGSNDILVREFDSGGNFVWATSMGGAGSEIGRAIALDGDGNIYTTGSFQATADFDPGAGTYNLTSTLDANGNTTSDVFVSKLTASDAPPPPPPPSLSINDVSVTEGNSGTTTATFLVTRSGDTTQEVSVDYATADGSAVAGSDYVAASGTLTFDPGVTSLTVSVTVNGDAEAEPDETFSVNLSNASTNASIADAQGIGTILNDDVPPTRFYVVDAAADKTFEYAAGGASVENYALRSGNNDPRGAASDASGQRVWVIDNDDYVYVYDAAGTALGSWKANGLSTPEGIASDGTDLWIVDRGKDRVFRFAGAASRTSGSASASSSFALNSGNKEATGIETDGASLWVVNNSSSDQVFKYTLGGSLVGSWTLQGGVTNPTGITLDPANPSDVWIVDATADKVFQYTAAAGRISGSQAAVAVFSLAAGNTNPQGIADPPVAAAARVGLTNDSARGPELPRQSQADRELTVMTRNLYLGADLAPVLRAQTPQEIIAAATGVWATVQATNFPERAEVLAGEIAAAQPDLIGLQEAVLWRSDPADFLSTPNAAHVEFDFIEILVGAMAERGFSYAPIVIATGFDAEALMLTAEGFVDIRLTDRDVILARTDRPVSELRLSNPQSANFDTNLTLPLLTGPFVALRSWASIDAQVRGRDVRFVTTHLEPFSEAIRVAQVQELLAGPGNTDLDVVFVGDFNTNPDDGTGLAYAALLEAGFTDVWSQTHPGAAGFTFGQAEDLRNAASLADARIDLVLFRGSELSALDAGLVGEEPADRTPSGLWPSDHAGIVATLGIHLRPREAGGTQTTASAAAAAGIALVPDWNVETAHTARAGASRSEAPLEAAFPGAAVPMRTTWSDSNETSPPGGAREWEPRFAPPADRSVAAALDLVFAGLESLSNDLLG